MNPLYLERLESLTLDGESVAELRYKGQAIWQGKTHVIRLAGTAEISTQATPGLLLIVPDALSVAVEATMATETEPAVLLVHPTEISPEVRLTLAVRPEPCVTLIQPDDMPIYISSDLNELVRQEMDVGASNLTLRRLEIAEAMEMQGAPEPLGAVLTIHQAGREHLLNLLYRDDPLAQSIRMVPADTEKYLPLRHRTEALAALEPAYKIANLPDALILGKYAGSAAVITIHPVVKNEPLPILHRYSGSGSLMVILPVASQESPTIEAKRSSSGAIVTVLLLPAVSGDEIIQTAAVSSGSLLTADPQKVSISGSMDTGNDARASKLVGDPQAVNVGASVATGQVPLVDMVQTKGEVIQTSVPLEAKESLCPQKTVTDPVSVIGEAGAKIASGPLLHISHPDDMPIATLLAVQAEESVIVEVIDGQWEYPYLDGAKLVIRQAYSITQSGTKIIIR